MEHSSSIEGGCHCGAIRWRLDAPGGPKTLPVRACQCSFCIRHGARYTSDPHAKLEIRISSDDFVERYRFGHQTTDFILCRRCGNLIAAVMEKSEGSGRAVVNINTADHPRVFTARARSTDFGAESRTERLARRNENWIGQVTWVRNPPD